MSATGRRTAPRFPACTAQFPEKCTAYLMGQYGVQAGDPRTCDDAARVLSRAFTGRHRPDVLDRGTFTDATGLANTVWFAYWLDPARHRAWVAEGRRPGAVPSAGTWWEESLVPTDSVETLHTHQQADLPTGGLAQVLPQHLTAQHDYWGAARDRIKGTPSGEAPRAVRHVRGNSVHVTVQGELCLIRTAQDWSRSTAFRDRYLRDVHPVKRKGVAYLAQHHAATGCLCVREIDETDEDGRALDRSCTLAWFASLDHLLTWTHSHKSHLDIYRSFFTVAADITAPLDVAFWHEVCVLPSGAVHAEYTNCHPGTGLLPLARPLATAPES
ncbi:phenylacetaldoxime dehydratase family protein [Streptomyces sclerotialus]|uniref:phenylacetaldoxime dehydratase family protein n=1 Tax=Streptomyces sclerotialus TaxID=1957 RepID=UPI0004C8248D